MLSESTIYKRESVKGRKRAMTALLVASGVLSGCSQVPDAVNPVEWYNSSVEFFSGEDEKPEQTAKAGAKETAKVPGADQAFPNLASVEQQKQRDDVRTKGLVADVEGRKYAPAVTRQGEAVNALGAPPPKPAAPTIAAVQPAPPAMPSVAVTSTGAAPLTASTAPAQPSTDPLATTQDHQKFQMQMANRLAEIRARANQGSGLPDYVAQPIGSDPVETVVISSSGIEAGYGAQAPAPAAMPVNSEFSYIQRPMAPLAKGAIRVATIMFPNGSSKLSSRDRVILANVRKLQIERGGRLRVVGHASSRTRNTDPVRHKMINFKVSAARADAVAYELVRMGLDKSKLQIDAVSDSTPVYYEFMPSGEAGNRRTEIYLES